MAAIKKKVTHLSLPEIAGRGFTHMMVLTANDLVETAANTAATYVVDIPTEAIIDKVELRLQVPFKDASDAALNTTTVSIGDTGSATRWVSAAECNVNGTEITAPQYATTSAGPYAASQQLIVTVGSMAAKSLVDVDTGEAHILFRLFLPKTLDDLQPAVGMTK